jgi:hypothetical protein
MQWVLVALGRTMLAVSALQLGHVRLNLAAGKATAADTSHILPLCTICSMHAGLLLLCLGASLTYAALQLS